MKYGQKKETIKNSTVEKTGAIERISSKAEQVKNLISTGGSKGNSFRDQNQFRRPQVATGKTGGDGKLVGLVAGQSTKVRPNSLGGPTRINSTSLSHEINYMNKGVRMSVATRHPSLASYTKAVKADMSMPLTQGSSFHGSRHQEYEYMRGSDHHVRISGREFLMNLSTVVAGPGSTLTVGERFPSGVAVLDPRGIGGRIQYFAESYAQHRFLKCRLSYEPVAPATQAGALFIYFAPDVGEITFVTGTRLLQHASTFPCFVQTSVWQACILDIDPQDAFVRYFDSTVGEFRTESQGIITVCAASDLPDEVAFGNLYLEYDVDFYSPELDFELEFRTEGVVYIDFSAVTGAMLAGNAVLASSGGIVAGYGGLSLLSGFPPGATAVIDLVDWMFYGVITSSTTGFNIDALGNGAALPLANGLCGWFRFWTSGAVVLTGFTPSLASASQDESGPVAYNTDALTYFAANYTFVGAEFMSFQGWWYLIR